ncbi:MAG: DUF4982 domain-containing protein [Lachnospiraceae bacterium]|nr:DUF4982 domain-containing protein [Lachnospiraceae bacterium]
MNSKILFHSDWSFCKKPLGTTLEEIRQETGFTPVELPHDWLIYNSLDLYETGEGWYRKRFTWHAEKDTLTYLNFEGIYMDSTIYINGVEAFCWKYGYSTFEFDATPYLTEGDNEILVRVVHQSPNSRWYSGAGIYRNVWLKTVPTAHFYTDGIYVAIRKQEEAWSVAIDSAIQAPDTVADKLSVRHSITAADGTLVSAAVNDVLDPAKIFCPYQNEKLPMYINSQTLPVASPKLWDIETPILYELTTELLADGAVIHRETRKIGFRDAYFTPDEGFLLNGRKVRLNGACEHHDLGSLGAAVNKVALRRQLQMLKEMGVNAIRTSHNMPAVEMMELADELGLLIVSEAFDMWERSKTTYDYARFFKEWCRRDVASWVRRDRNHVSVILWSIGNEIYDTHADDHGQEISRMLMDYVHENDPKHNAPVTIGSNFMPWEGAQKCADIVKYAGYNYSEKYYDEHHAKYPDWIIYGSETASVVQSRGIYHFPSDKPILADDDEQCSSLANSTTSWGARSTLACIADDRDTPYSAGQFIWTGFDYIGEPTPYHTKNSYFGQIDTAGFPKDSFYIFQSEWTDYRKAPMIHICPYWDFNEGQTIDILVCSNAPRLELFFDGESLGAHDLDHEHGRDDLLCHYRMPYRPGTLTAVAYDENGNEIARDTKTSFGDAAHLVLTPDRTELTADGRDLIFVTISAEDAAGNPVENANNRVEVTVTGAGRLVGLDNGDSTDYDQYKGTSRRLFSGKLLAIIAAKREAGNINVCVSSASLPDATLTLTAVPMTAEAETAEAAAGILIPCDAVLMENPKSPANTEIPIRKIALQTNAGQKFSPELTTMEITATLYPVNATASDLIWKVTTDTGIDSNLAKLEVNGTTAKITACGDGKFVIRCMTKNGTDKYRIISTLDFTAEGLGSATINPYQFVSGGLYDVAIGTITSGNERGLATARGEETTFGFTNVDFGDFGSDELTVPIFALDGDAYPIKIWEGIPGEEGTELLAEVVYQKPSIWNVYQEDTFRLKRRIKGLTTICFTTYNKIHFKGFSFTAPQKAYAELSALDNNHIYGDTFTVEHDAITGIGNNVSLEYENMDFGEKGFSRLFINGRSELPNNTIHVRFATADGEIKQIAEFAGSADYVTREFALDSVTGCCKVTFVFLPGCQFDFKWFRFE